MLFFIITVLFTIGLAIYLTKKVYSSSSTIPTTPPSTIHDEIAKTIAELKAQDPIIIEAPFVAEKVEEDKSKKKTTTAKKTVSKNTAKVKPLAKMEAKKKITKKTTKK
jgi:hypothetical protein